MVYARYVLADINIALHQKETRSLVLRVQSAFVREQEKLHDRSKWHTIKLETILYNAFNGKPLKR